MPHTTNASTRSVINTETVADVSNNTENSSDDRFVVTTSGTKETHIYLTRNDMQFIKGKLSSKINYGLVTGVAVK